MTPEQEQAYLKTASHEDVCRYLASKIRRERMLRRESQEALTQRAGVALRTFKRLETNGRGHLDTFVKVLKALDKGHYLQLLFPIPSGSPNTSAWDVRLAALKEKQRLRIEKRLRSNPIDET